LHVLFAVGAAGRTLGMKLLSQGNGSVVDEAGYPFISLALARVSAGTSVR
jgi:hypothetical protein